MRGPQPQPHWDRKRRRWYARFSVNGVQKYFTLGQSPQAKGAALGWGASRVAWDPSGITCKHLLWAILFPPTISPLIRAGGMLREGVTDVNGGGEEEDEPDEDKGNDGAERFQDLLNVSEDQAP